MTQALQGGPEPVKRRQAQTDALTRLARMERIGRSAGPPGQPAARPHLTRLESPQAAAGMVHRPRTPVPWNEADLSAKQLELLQAVGDTTTVSEAASGSASAAATSTPVFAGSPKLGVWSGPELVGLARQGLLPPDRQGPLPPDR